MIMLHGLIKSTPKNEKAAPYLPAMIYTKFDDKILTLRSLGVYC